MLAYMLLLVQPRCHLRILSPHRQGNLRLFAQRLLVQPKNAGFCPKQAISQIILLDNSLCERFELPVDPWCKPCLRTLLWSGLRHEIRAVVLDKFELKQIRSNDGMRKPP